MKKDPQVTFIKDSLKVCKLRPEAEYPYKERPDDIGYDVTLISRSENRSEDTVGIVNYFDTGISISPPKGHYVDVVARSSLHKTGYMLATGTSIIDPGYTGELKIPLFKFKQCDDIELPFRGVQLILRPAVYAHLSGVKSLSKTSRGEGSFGSTGFIPQGGSYYQPEGLNQQNFNSIPNNKQNNNSNYMF